MEAAEGSLPCLFPCSRGLNSILSAAGLLRPDRICKAVGSGRRPFPRFTALEEKSDGTNQRQNNNRPMQHIDFTVIPWFVQRSELPACFFQEGPGHRRTPWCASRPAACHLWVAVLPQPSLQWWTPTQQNAGNFRLVPEPTRRKTKIQ